MSMFRIVFLSVALVAASLAGTASAMVMQATYTGTIFASVDETNMFGAGSSLDGLGFRLTYSYDPEAPGVSRVTTSERDNAFGGSLFGTTSPVQSVALTINKVTKFLDPISFSSIVGEDNGIVSGVNQLAQYGGSSNGKVISNIITAGASGRPSMFPVSLDESVPLTRLAAGEGGGFFGFNECMINDDGLCEATIRTVGSLAPSSVRIAPIPLPAALPLLASGLAGLGFVAFGRGRWGQAAA